MTAPETGFASRSDLIRWLTTGPPPAPSDSTLALRGEDIACLRALLAHAARTDGPEPTSGLMKIALAPAYLPAVRHAYGVACACVECRTERRAQWPQSDGRLREAR